MRARSSCVVLEDVPRGRTSSVARRWDPRGHHLPRRLPTAAAALAARRRRDRRHRAPAPPPSTTSTGCCPVRDPELREAGNLPDFDRGRPSRCSRTCPRSPASGRLLPLIAIDPRAGECAGGGTLHHLDAERSIIEIGYWLLPTPAAGPRHADRAAAGRAQLRARGPAGRGLRERRQPRLRARARAGRLRREGVVRSMPVPSGAGSTRRCSTVVGRVTASGDAP